MLFRVWIETISNLPNRNINLFIVGRADGRYCCCCLVVVVVTIVVAAVLYDRQKIRRYQPERVEKSHLIRPTADTSVMCRGDYETTTRRLRDDYDMTTGGELFRFLRLISSIKRLYLSPGQRYLGRRSMSATGSLDAGNSPSRTPDSRLQAPDSNLPTPGFQLQVPDSGRLTLGSGLPTPGSRLQTGYEGQLAGLRNCKSLP